MVEDGAQNEAKEKVLLTEEEGKQEKTQENEALEDEDDLIDIDGQDGPEPTMKAADELKAAIGQGQGNIDIDILANDPESSRMLHNI